MNAAPLPVLLVDDDAAVRRALGRWIRGRLDLLECETLEQALAVIERRDQPLFGAIVDVFLNGRNGLDLIPALRQRSPAMPILVLTGHRLPEITHRAFQLGAHMVLKPPPAETIQHFARLVELAHAHCWDVVDAVQRLGARCALSPAQTPPGRPVRDLRLARAGGTRPRDHREHVAEADQGAATTDRPA